MSHIERCHLNLTFVPSKFLQCNDCGLRMPQTEALEMAAHCAGQNHRPGDIVCDWDEAVKAELDRNRLLMEVLVRYFGQPVSHTMQRLTIPAEPRIDTEPSQSSEPDPRNAWTVEAPLVQGGFRISDGMEPRTPKAELIFAKSDRASQLNNEMVACPSAPEMKLKQRHSGETKISKIW